ncbi:MAG: PDZ domain-containing protein [Isosphaeraceae bacterium]
MFLPKMGSIGLALALSVLAPVRGQVGDAVKRYEAAGRLLGYVQGAGEAKVAEPQETWELLTLGSPMEPGPGLSLVPLDDATRAHLKLPRGEGLLVASVTAHSPAAAAGVHPNDILLSIDDGPLSKPEDLEARLKAAGEKPQTLSLLRQGQKKTIKVQPQVIVTFGPVQAEATSYFIGVNVGSLDPALRSQLSVPEGRGLIAIDVVPESPAAKAGLKVNDILLTMAGTPLRDQEALVEAVQKNGEKTAALEIIREGNGQTIEITPQKRSTSIRFTGRARVPGRYRDVLDLNVPRAGALLYPKQPGVMSFFPSTANQPNVYGGVWNRANPDDRRLDALEGELKELRKSVEELTKALKDRR